MKIRYIIIMVFILLFANTTACFSGETKKEIPLNIRFMKYEFIHHIKNKKQKEYFCYQINKDDIIGKIHLEKTDEKGFRQIKKKKKFYYKRKIDPFINILNETDFLSVNESLHDKTRGEKPPETITEFLLEYRYNGKIVRKQAMIENIDRQIEQNTCNDAFKLRYLMAFTDEYIFRVYKRGKKWSGY